MTGKANPIEAGIAAALRLYNEPLQQLQSWATAQMRHRRQKCVTLCSIYSIRTGACSEDCRFCAQSGHTGFSKSVLTLPDEAEVVRAAQGAVDAGVRRFSLVSSGLGPSDTDLLQWSNLYRKLGSIPDVNLCASHGVLSLKQAEQLKSLGVSRYHHNLETSEDYYSQICSTHSYAARLETLANAKAAGLELCSGGILGMGESRLDRIQMALTLKQLEVQSVPLNLLTPIPGTPLEHAVPLSLEEILKTLAIYRILLPKAEIRLAGGRSQVQQSLSAVFESGVNGLMTGDYLTTAGIGLQEDIETVEELGFSLY